nr:glycosyltransferase [uncultured Vibrio sp.]
MNVVIIVAPGFKKKTGYYFRAVRDFEALSNIGHSLEIIGFDGKGFFCSKGEALTIKDAMKTLESSDMLVFQNIAVAVLGLLFKSKRRVIVVHGSLDDLDEFRFSFFKKIVYRFILKYTLLHFDKIVTVSEAMNDYLNKIVTISKDKLITIPNLPNGSFLDNVIKANENRLKLRSELGLCKGKKYICYCGNTQGWQKVDYLLEIFSIISEIYDNIDLIILTRDSDVFNNKLINFGVNPKRVVVKSVDNDVVPKYLVTSDLLYLIRDENSVNYVACPTKAIEYLVSGTPIVLSSNLGDISSIVKRDNKGIVLNQTELSNKTVVAKRLGKYLISSSKFSHDIDITTYSMRNYEDQYRNL